MARFTIYSKDGQIKRHEGEPQYSGSYMGVDFVEFRTISYPTPIDWQIGDYVDYYRTGKRYRLYSLPMPKKVARKGEYGASFEYSNVQLYGATKELEIAPFRDLVPKDNKIHFSTRPDVSTYENVYGIARRIQECMDDLYPNKWRIEVYDTDDTDLLSLFEETKEYSVSDGSCLDALSQIYETWKNVGWIHTYDSANKVDVITIGRANVRNADNTSDSFAFGVGKGLTSIKKASANKDEFATRLYIYGSERNIQTRYYNGLDILNKDSVDIRNLMLPIEKWGKTNGLPDASKAYLQADDSIIEKYGLIPRTVYFDGSKNEEIYPSIVGLTERRVRQAMINAGQSSSPNLPPDRDVRLDVVASVDFSKDSGDKTAVESNPTFKLYYGHLGFNLADQGRLTSEGYAVISMKSGACAGREFVVQSSEDTGDGYGLMYQIAVVKRTWDESLGMGFPNEIYPIKNGDEFVILDIPMPDYYITLAADDLLSAGEKMLADYTRVSAFYEPSVDAIKIKEGGKLLQAGMFMQVYDEDIIDTADKKDYVLIDTLTIDEKSDLPIYRVTLREQKRSARTYSALEDMIEDARESNKQEISRVRQYTDRRFRSAQETLDMLQGAFENFSDGIDPVTIKTMATLVGDESLQYKFTSASNSLTDIACPLYYDETTKQMKSSSAYLKHMTLGIKEITTGALSASSYLTWRLPAWSSPMLEDADQSYYVYIKATKNGNASECLLSKTAIGMEDVSGYYHFLVGILNSEYDGKRDFITLYGFTEVLPGQITTDVLRSANSNLIIDLLNAKISAKNGATIEGKVTFQSGSSGLENLSEWSGKQQQIDNAQSTADTASQNAQKAQGDATQAKKVATDAQNVADEAGTAAQNAQTKAESAQASANNAQATANSAQSAAAGAQKTADEAKGIAQNAKLFTDSLNNDSILTEVEKREIRRLMSEITECTGASVTEYNAKVVRSAISGNAWYLVNDKSYAEYADSEGKKRQVSQKAWVGYYSSNMHTNSGTTVTRIGLTILKPLSLKVKFGSDAEVSYDYLNISALDVSVNPTGTEHSLTDSTKQASTKGKQGIANVMTKTFAFDGKTSSHFIELSYRKDSADSVGTDSGYYRLMNDSYVGVDGNEYIVEMNGSFHRHYLTLMRNGYTAEATELKTRLNALMSFLNTYGLWTSGNTTSIPTTFRASLNDYVAKYYSYAAEIGFDISMNRLNDAEYLTNAMKNGRTIIDGGLVMSSMVAVADSVQSTDADVQAFLNGSDFAKDTTEHGKLILAGGIPSSVQYEEDGETITSTDLERRSKKAATRIYEDGTIDTSKIIAKQGELSGFKFDREELTANINVSDGGYTQTQKTTISPHKISIEGTEVSDNEEGYKTQVALYPMIAGVVPTATAGIIRHELTGAMSDDLFGGITSCATLILSAKGALPINDRGFGGNFVIQAESGMFAGLRPQVRVITTNLSSSNTPHTLSQYDHTIIINVGSGSVTIKTPSAPQDGQVYEIYTCHHTMDLTIDFNGKSAYSFIEAKNKTSDTFTSDYRRHITLIYAGGQWWEDYRYLY